MRRFGISYGVLEPPIINQLSKLGFEFDQKKVDVFQKELDAIHQLRLGSGILTDSMADKCFERLHKKLVDHICVKNKVTLK